MPTNNPRCYVTFSPHMWDLVKEFRTRLHIASMSSAVVMLVAAGLMHYKTYMRYDAVK